MATKALQVGDRVTVGQTELMGTVKFLGSTEFAAGEWLGIELDEQAGKNDGSVKGKRYFESKPEHGIFVRPTAATKVDTATAAVLQPPSVSVAQVVSPVEEIVPPIQAAKRFDAPSNRSSRSSGTLAPPGTEKPKRLSERSERSLELQKASVQLELAQAMEDHNVESIRRLIPVATNLQIDAKEITAAKHILSFEVQQNLSEEVNTVRDMISELSEAVAKVEEKAASLKHGEPAIVLVKSYGVLGRSNNGQKEGLPDEDTVIVDPAGLPFVRGDRSLRDVKGAAQANYMWLEISENESFPPDVRQAITKECQAKYHVYANGKKKCIHVVGPDFREASGDFNHAVEQLAIAYGNVFEEFCTIGMQQGLRKMRLLPISGGIFGGPFREDLPEMTARAVQKAYEKLTEDRKHYIMNSTIEMCIFMESEFEMFSNAFATPQSIDKAVLKRIGPELERRVLAKIQPTIERMLRGVISKITSKLEKVAKSKTGLEDHVFEDFDLNKDGVITREEFDEVRSKILRGETLSKASLAAEPDLATQEAAAGKIQAIYRGRMVREAAVPPIQSMEAPSKICRALLGSVYAGAAAMQKDLAEQEVAAGKIQAIYRGRMAREQAAQAAQADKKPAESEADLAEQEAAAGKIQAIYRGRMARDQALCLAVRRSVYVRAATLQKVLNLGVDHYASVRWCVKELFKRAAVRSAEMLAQSVEQKRAEAFADIESIRASKKRIEEAERKAEEQVTASSIKLQACARGKIARQQRQLLESRVRTLQRGFRRLRQRRQQGHKMDFAAVVRAVRGQRKDWTLEFHLASGSHEALQHDAFVAAMQKVDMNISTAKVEKLWQGFVQQSNEKEMHLQTFWAICEAVAQGDALAAEFADMSLEEYLDGEDGQKYSEEEILAAQRIQAAQRGCQVRMAQAAAAPSAPTALEQAAAERIQAALQGRMLREQEAAAERIQACHRGRMVREQWLNEASLAVEPDLATQEAAAGKIQAIYRGRMVREQAKAVHRPSSSSTSRDPVATASFEEALSQQGSGSRLLLPAFRQAMTKASPLTSESQVKALFDGTCEGTGQDGISLKLFCDIIQAVQLGDDAASQFADLHVEDYQALAA